MKGLYRTLCVLLFTLWSTETDAWWNLGIGSAKSKRESYDIQLSPPNGVKALTPRQQRLARKYANLMQYVAGGAQRAISECQRQFHKRRWNCSSHNPENVFGNILKIACRETAFTYSITAAGVAHSVARACSEDRVKECGCDSRYRGVSTAGWQWGGCSDNIHFADGFTEKFVDAREKGRDFRTVVNKHNNGAGRAAVRNNMVLECKCHGVSEACTVRTCWKRLPGFNQVGELLKTKFDSASKVEFELNNNRNGHGKAPFRPINKLLRAPTENDLVYYEESPKFCDRDVETGSLGTNGRECNSTSLGTGGCDLLCCGRGYTTSEKDIVEQCNCRFIWCCKVKCDQCKNKRIVHRCR